MTGIFVKIKTKKSLSLYFFFFAIFKFSQGSSPVCVSIDIPLRIALPVALHSLTIAAATIQSQVIIRFGKLKISNEWKVKGSLSSGCANRGRTREKNSSSPECGGQTAQGARNVQASALAVALCSSGAKAETCCAEKIGMAIEAALLLIIIS